MKHKKTDNSPVVPQEEKIKFELDIKERFQLSDKQKNILETALHKDTRCVFIDGLFGTSKTYLAVLASLKLLSSKRIDKIIYVRSPTEAGSVKLGFLPGERSDKMAPYNYVFYQKLEELLPKIQVEKLEKECKIDCISLGFTRGYSWNTKAIIIDEAAGLTFADLILLLSRCGEFTRIFIVGDSINQNDIGSKSGFKKMFDCFNDEESRKNGVFNFELKDQGDIVRSGFLRFVMEKTGIIKKPNLDDNSMFLPENR